jgi:glycosyltransferase involved in cell wall biosynthesis
MNHDPLISVIIPTWNEAKYLGPCIRAINSQTYSNFEVIVVDTGSTDGTQEICKSAAWHVHQLFNPCISVARAEGCAQSRGEVIVSTDADTIVSSHWLSTIARTMNTPGVVATYGPVLFVEGVSHPCYGFINILARLFFGICHFAGKDHGIGSNFAIRKSAYRAVGGYNLTLHTAEDVDLSYRAQRVGRMIYDPKLLVYTSNRRLAHEKARFFLHHFRNYIRITFHGTASKNFEPVR